MIVSILAVIISFAGGFLIANSLNRNEMEKLRVDNERLVRASAETTEKAAEFTLTKEEIQSKISEADSNPADIRFNRDLGIALYRYSTMKNDVELMGEAIRILERANALDPSDNDLLVALGHANFDVANLGKQPARFLTARQIYEKAIVKMPNDAGIRTDLALTYFLQEPPNLDTAVEEFRNALKLDGKNERAMQFLIQAYWKMGRSEDAVPVLDDLKKVNSKNPSIPELESLLTRGPASP